MKEGYGSSSRSLAVENYNFYIVYAVTESRKTFFIVIKLGLLVWMVVLFLKASAKLFFLFEISRHRSISSYVFTKNTSDPS